MLGCAPGPHRAPTAPPLRPHRAPTALKSAAMSQDEPKSPKRRIETSALDKDKVAEIEDKLYRISQIKSAKIKRRDLELDDERLPLATVESMIGFRDQGDVFRNDLDLLFDRLQGEAEPPEFSPPADEGSAAFEPIGAPSAGDSADARAETPAPVEASSLGGFNFSDLDFSSLAAPAGDVVVVSAAEDGGAGAGDAEDDVPFEALERLMGGAPATPRAPARPAPAAPAAPLSAQGDEVDTWNDPEE